MRDRCRDPYRLARRRHRHFAHRRLERAKLLPEMLGELERLREQWQWLAEEVEQELQRRRSKGGQQTGPGGEFGNAPPSMLLALERRCRAALGAEWLRKTEE